MLTGKVTDKRMHYVQLLYRLCDYLINCESVTPIGICIQTLLATIP